MNTTPKEKTFPSIDQLLKDTWTLFTKSALTLTLLYLVTLVPYLVVCVLIGLGSGIGIVAFSKSFDHFSSSLILPGIILLVLYILLILIGILIGPLLQAGTLLIFNAKQPFSLRTLVGKSARFILPLLGLGIVLGFIIAGGYFLFIIPGILFALFFLFAPFIYVLEKTSLLGSMRQSMGMVTAHFGAVFLRILLIGLVVSILYAIVFPIYFITTLIPIIGIVGYIFFQIVNVIIGWFLAAYIYTLYKHISGLGHQKQETRLVWILVTAIIGWIVGILLLAMIVIGIVGYVSSQEFKRSIAESKSPSTRQVSPADEYIKSGQLKMQTANQLGVKQNLTQSEQDQIFGLVNGALQDFITATEKDPKNYLVWYYKGEAYRNLIGATKNADAFAIEAYTKSISLNPSYINSYLARGGVYYQLKEYDKAIENFKKIIELEPENINGYYNLAFSYKQIGNRKNARESLLKVLEYMKEDDKDRGKVEKELQNL